MKLRRTIVLGAAGAASLALGIAVALAPTAASSASVRAATTSSSTCQTQLLSPASDPNVWHNLGILLEAHVCSTTLKYWAVDIDGQAGSNGQIPGSTHVTLDWYTQNNGPTAITPNSAGYVQFNDYKVGPPKYMSLGFVVASSGCNSWLKKLVASQGPDDFGTTVGALLGNGCNDLLVGKVTVVKF